MNPKNIIAVIVVMALIMVAVPVFGVDSSDATGTGNSAGGSTTPTEYSGTCGTNLNWTFTVSSKTLTINHTSSTNDCKLDPISSWKTTGDTLTASKLLSDNKGFELEVEAAKLTTLGTVFKGSGVASITLGNVTTIPSSGFEGCTYLTTISLTKVTLIGASAFEGCTKLSSVTIPAAVTKLESSTFEGCTSLTSITIPATVTSMGTDCFKGCTSLGTVTFTAPSSSATSYIKDIPEGAFDGCTSLSKVNLNDSIESIGKNAFRGTKLTEADLKNIKTVHQDAFAGVTTLSKFKIGTNNASFYTDSAGVFLYSKDKAILHMVAHTKTGTFDADDLESSVRTIYLGYAGVTFMLDYTKIDYTFKKEATTPKAIGIEYSTQGVDGTMSPMISSGKLSVTYKLYDGWSSDKYKVIGSPSPTDVKMEKLNDGKCSISFTVKPGAYYEVLPVGARGVTEDQLKAVTNIGGLSIGSVTVLCEKDPSTGYITKLLSYTCKVTGFTGAGKATISDTLVTQYGVECNVIGVTGETGYPNMTELVITDDVDLSAGAFADNHKLTTVRLDKVDSIGERMFRYCTSLKTVDAPMCKTIGKYAFEGCLSLESPVFAVIETMDDTAFINSGVNVIVVGSDSTMASAGDMLLIKTALPCKVSFDMDGDMLLITGATSLGSIGYSFTSTGDKTPVGVYKGGFTAFPVGSEDVLYLSTTAGTNDARCMVVMDTLLGGNITPVAVDSGKKLSEVLVSPVMDGYTFRGWSIDPDSRVAVDMTGTVSTSTAYYAIWEAEGNSPNMLMYTIVSLAVSLVASVLIIFLGTRTR